jgi:hypothetical protein
MFAMEIPPMFSGAKSHRSIGYPSDEVHRSGESEGKPPQRPLLTECTPDRLLHSKESAGFTAQ